MSFVITVRAVPSSVKDVTMPNRSHGEILFLGCAASGGGIWSCSQEAAGASSSKEASLNVDSRRSSW